MRGPGNVITEGVFSPTNAAGSRPGSPHPQQRLAGNAIPGAVTSPQRLMVEPVAQFAGAPVTVVRQASPANRRTLSSGASGRVYQKLTPRQATPTSFVVTSGQATPASPAGKKPA